MRPGRKLAPPVASGFENLSDGDFFQPSLYRAHNAVSMLEQWAGAVPLTVRFCRGGEEYRVYSASVSSSPADWAAAINTPSR